MIDQEQALAKLERMVKSDLAVLSENLYTRVGDVYCVFNQYEICCREGMWQVIKHRRDPRVFSALPSALAWCIADKHQQHNLSIQIANLDKSIGRLRQDINTRVCLRNKMLDDHLREAVDTKLVRRQLTLQVMISELDKYVNRAKYLQIRGFHNETARTGRPASNR